MSTVDFPAGVQVFERGWLSANNILFTGDGPVTLIDSGYVTHAAQTLALVEHALGERPLERLMNTHLHSDHCGGNAALQARYGCHTAIPAPESAAVSSWNDAALTYQATGQQCPRFSFDATLVPGQRLMLAGAEWEVLGAPGHHPHAVMFWSARDGILIPGDALWRNGFGVIFPELEGEPGFEEARATLELIGTLDARIVIPGHGAVFTDVAAALGRARTRLDFLQADPVRNAENAIKVMLKFLLLERQQMPLPDIAALMEAIPLVATARRLYFDMDPAALADWAVTGLVRAGAARRDGDVLRNRDLVTPG